MHSVYRLAVILGLLACGVTAQNFQTINLEPFSSLSVCTPFNIAVQPGPGYALQIAADESVRNALRATVASNVLSLQTVGAFTTSQPIQAIVSLPAANLAGVSVIAPQTAVLLRNGFTPKQLTAAVSGNSSLLAESINAAATALTATGYVCTFSSDALKPFVHSNRQPAS